MLQRSYLIFAACFSAFCASAQSPKPAPKPAQQPVAVQTAPPAPTVSYKRLNKALEYAFIIDKPTSPKPKEGDLIKVNMQSASNGRLLFNTFQNNKGKPAEFTVNKPNFSGDIIEAIMLMSPGDSLVCMVDATTLFNNTKNKKPDFIKPGDKVQYFVKLVSVKTAAQIQKEQQAAFNKQIQQQLDKQKKETAKQMQKDDKALKDYFLKNNLNPTKSESGLYYTIHQEGSGDKPVSGDTVVMNYTGTLLDGTKFDSNTDSAFSHVQPFEFALGLGQVIKGWDEGVSYLKPGSKATFYIPSPMAYGAQARPGGGANPKGIPANSILLFDVELVSIKKPQPKPATETPPTQPNQQTDK